MHVFGMIFWCLFRVIRENNLTDTSTVIVGYFEISLKKYSNAIVIYHDNIIIYTAQVLFKTF